MKQKLKLFLLLLFVGSMLFLQSCEKDLYEEPVYKEKSKAKVKIFSLEEVFKKEKNLKSYNRIPKKKISKTNNISLSLYKTDDNFTYWKKLYLDNNNQVKELPCL